jgi:hypothetical protein
VRLRSTARPFAMAINSVRTGVQNLSDGQPEQDQQRADASAGQHAVQRRTNGQRAHHHEPNQDRAAGWERLLRLLGKLITGCLQGRA